MKVLDYGHIVLLDSMGTDLDIINAARKSFNKEAKEFSVKDRRLLKYLWDNKHLSVFEMVVFKFGVKLPIFVARQWMRHRAFSYNERSFRYTAGDLDFYYPEKLRLQSQDNKQGSEGSVWSSEDNYHFIKEMKTSVGVVWNTYEELIEEGVARELARIILPQNVYTEMIFKADLRNLLNFIDLRLHPHAQEEIRVYAEAIVELITPIVPETMRLFIERRIA
jgi:thymidylate synthase (FAD)